MLANKLHKSLFGTPYQGKGTQPPEISAPIATQTGLISIQYLKPGKSAPLSDLRNTKALRVPRGSASKILLHPQSEALILYLELKALVTSSIIFSSNGNLPYERIRAFTNESLTTIRNRIRALKKMQLCWIVDKQHFRLASFQQFRSVVGITCKRTHKIQNNGETRRSLKLLAISENLERQKYVVKKKIFQRELLEMKASYNGLDPVNPTKRIYAKDCHGESWNKAFIRKFKKHFNKSWDYYQRKYEKVYNYQSQQIDLGRPSINPYVTLSCEGTAKACGVTSKSSGHRIQRELHNAGLMECVGFYRMISDRSTAIFEQQFLKIRTDLFAYKYPTRDGMKRMWFINLCNQLTPFVDRIERRTIKT